MLWATGRGDIANIISRASGTKSSSFTETSNRVELRPITRDQLDF